MPRQTKTSPDYVGLVEFLIEPLLDNPESLYANSEVVREKIWLRVAFDSESRGKVFGRGGRNIQAIRTVIDTAAALAGHSVYLDIYDGEKSDRPTRQASNNSGRKNKSRSSKEKPRIAKKE
ncbi:KH domain-containing protein [Myxosarcina sp. GI1]|uniref:KH domain-containing protein n=1 Tax=Myxosarcina sp. GI1 TaxID=1541065 RepID=UPI00056CCF5E|nr:KH domain-containing protein [Myxosarcina sp. GI1]